MKALINSEPHMKIARPTTLLTVAMIALSFSVVGCKKGVTKPTTLGGTGPRGITGDERGGPIIGNVPAQSDRNSVIGEPPSAISLSDPGQGFKQPDRSFDNWFADSNVFKDQTVYFDYDKHNVKPSEVAKLSEVARRMKSFPGMALRIEGHCDERGTEEYNRALGDKRAQAIRESLASEGLDPGMMPTITFGEDKPADPSHSEAAFSKNRRGALVLLSARPHSGEQPTSEFGETKALRNSE